MFDDWTWLGLAVGCSLEAINLWFGLRVNCKESLRPPRAIPIVPIAINVYSIAHMEVSVYAKLAGYACAVLLEALAIFVIPKLYTQWWNGLTPLHRAARRGDLAAVQALLRSGADMNARDNLERSPVELAALGGHVAVVEILAEAGAELGRYNASVRGNARSDVLGLAAACGQLDVVKLLVSRGVPINGESGNSPALAAAIRMGHRDVVQFLLGRGAEQGTNVGGLTPIHEAAERGYIELLADLLAQGADINAEDRWGRTPLAYLQGRPSRFADAGPAPIPYRPDPATVNWLMEHGAHD